MKDETPEKDGKQPGKGRPKTLSSKEAEDLLSHTMLSSPFLQNLTPELVKNLAGIAARKTAKPGEQIFSRGEPALGFHLLSKGKVKIYVSDASGRERTIKIVQRGEFFGEAAIFQREGYPASSEAMTKTESFYFPKREMLRLIGENPELAFATIGIMANRLAHFAALLESSLKEVLPRLAAYVLTLPERGGKIKLPAKKVELARHLGTTAESLSRALGELKTKGVLKEEDNHIIILKRERLTRLADGD
ncbi:MAG: Crp/Fnr family transcriptional regulator [Deltaproteobacteria bacterium]|jgi:CRP/FNR family transcriptional regulator|nr:Crp/Fnr family transcriptional regulator [Deltaproteobacteria bacterium]